MKGAGFIGAHRTGKTTLATQVSMNTDLPLVLTQTSGVVERLGIDLTKPITFQDQMRMQWEILTCAEKLWAAERGMFITDRTPLDMIGYTLTRATPYLSNTEERDLMEYIDACWRVATYYFAVVILVSPGIELVKDEHRVKGPLRKGYIEQLHAIYSGLLLDERCEFARYVIPRKNTDLAKRTEWSVQVIEKELFSAAVRELTTAVVH